MTDIVDDPQHVDISIYQVQKDDPMTENCPICGLPLIEGDSLVMYFYPHRNWWVIDHYSPSRSKSSKGDYCGAALTYLNGVMSALERKERVVQ